MNDKDCNVSHLAGTLSRDPRIFDSVEGKMPFCRINLEVELPGAIDGNLRKSWHLLKGFGRDLVSQFKGLYAGSRIDVFGPLQTRSYTGPDGLPRYVTELVIDRGNLTILKAVTEPADPMIGYSPDAAASAAKELRIEHEVNLENRAEAMETVQSDENILEDEDIPF